MLLMHGKIYDTLAPIIRVWPSYRMLPEMGFTRHHWSGIVHIRVVQCLMCEIFRNERCDFILYSALHSKYCDFMLLKPEFILPLNDWLVSFCCRITMFRSLLVKYLKSFNSQEETPARFPVENNKEIKPNDDVTLDSGENVWNVTMLLWLLKMHPVEGARG